MQALIATSRSISQDPFLDRQNKRKYDQHVKKIENINIQKSFPIIIHAKDSQKMAQTLYKSKQSAKTFRESEEKTEIKRENRILLEKIWKMNSNIKTDNNVMHLQHQSGSNWFLKKKQAEAIKQENKRLAMNIISSKTDVKQYKKKLQNQIKQYLQLRSHIRKFDFQTEKKKKLQRAQSQKKGFRLTLHDQQDQNNKQVQQKDQSDRNQKKQQKKQSKNKSKVEKSISPSKLIIKQKAKEGQKQKEGQTETKQKALQKQQP